jgi:hypothetical protein
MEEFMAKQELFLYQYYWAGDWHGGGITAFYRGAV